MFNINMNITDYDNELYEALADESQRQVCYSIDPARPVFPANSLMNLTSKITYKFDLHQSFFYIFYRGTFSRLR